MISFGDAEHSQNNAKGDQNDAQRKPKLPRRGCGIRVNPDEEDKGYSVERDTRKKQLEEIEIQVARMGIEVVDSLERQFQASQILSTLTSTLRCEGRGTFQVFVKALKWLSQENPDHKKRQADGDFYRDLGGGHLS